MSIKLVCYYGVTVLRYCGIAVLQKKWHYATIVLWCFGVDVMMLRYYSA